MHERKSTKNREDLSIFTEMLIGAKIQVDTFKVPLFLLPWKTPFAVSIVIHLFRLDSSLCRVEALLFYLNPIKQESHTLLHRNVLIVSFSFPFFFIWLFFLRTENAQHKIQYNDESMINNIASALQ